MVGRVVGWFETLAQVLMAFAVFALCQPWWLGLYKRGFLILLVGTGLFIVVTHIPTAPREAT